MPRSVWRHGGPVALPLRDRGRERSPRAQKTSATRSDVDCLTRMVGIMGSDRPCSQWVRRVICTCYHRQALGCFVTCRPKFRWTRLALRAFRFGQFRGELVEGHGIKTKWRPRRASAPHSTPQTAPPPSVLHANTRHLRRPPTTCTSPCHAWLAATPHSDQGPHRHSVPVESRRTRSTLTTRRTVTPKSAC
jgi:hypothetical protein